MKFYNVIIKTALHMAVENRNLEIIKLLISKPKIDLNSKLTINKIGVIILMF